MGAQKDTGRAALLISSSVPDPLTVTASVPGSIRRRHLISPIVPSGRVDRLDSGVLGSGGTLSDESPYRMIEMPSLNNDRIVSSVSISLTATVVLRIHCLPHPRFLRVAMS